LLGEDGAVLTPDAVLDGQVLTGDLSGQSAANARFLECTFQRCDLTELRAPRARFSDSGLYAVHGAGVDLAESTWRDCVVQGARLGAVQLFGAELRRVRFEGCKIEFLNLRGATLVDVQLVDCQLVEPDLAEATLAQVSFEGSRVVSPELGRARMTDVDLSAADLVAPRGLAGLRGATISPLQLIDLGPALAAELGITVAD
jgi:uncharacterized protein YjbI with pentapeptide repeats